MHKRPIKHKLSKTQITNTACVLFVVCVVSLIAFYPRAARADPHAVFYTAIAQQQLFYNVLAALDQADYVETRYTREELLKERAKAGEKEGIEPPFEEEKFPLTETTKVGTDEAVSPTDPGIADLLTRAITLEGTDLYSDQLVREYGAEHGRRNSTSELLRALCDYGLGLENCEYNLTATDTGTSSSSSELKTIEDKRRGAIVMDPLDWKNKPVKDGTLAAFMSGTAEDTQERIRRYNKEGGERLPMAYSPAIAAWREYVRNSDDPAFHSELLARLLDNATSTILGPPDDQDIEYPYKNLVRGRDGKVEVNCEGEERGISCQEETARQVLFAEQAATRIGAAAHDRIAAQQELMEEQGLLADVVLKSSKLDSPAQAGTPASYVNPEELSVVVKNPVAVRTADVYSLPQILGLLDTSQRASALKGIDLPGSKQLVEREKAAGPSCYCSMSEEGYTDPPGLCRPGTPEYYENCSAGSVSGLQSTVAGTGLNLFGLDPRYDEPKEPTSPSANLIAGHLEQGAVQALRVLTAGNFRQTPGVPQCGFTCY